MVGFFARERDDVIAKWRRGSESFQPERNIVRTTTVRLYMTHVRSRGLLKVGLLNKAKFFCKDLRSLEMLIFCWFVTSGLNFL